MIRRAYIILIVTLLTFASQLNAQTVGLVLSGGGAKGMAHIGVIRALEENGIPIDYIAGTSMGAVIGSLYAMGYSPDEMEALISSDDFKNWYMGSKEVLLKLLPIRTAPVVQLRRPQRLRQHLVRLLGIHRPQRKRLRVHRNPTINRQLARHHFAHLFLLFAVVIFTAHKEKSTPITINGIYHPVKYGDHATG